MLDTPVDVTYLWVGVAVASLAAVGVAVSLPTTTPPDPQPVAATVDTVATSPHEATGQHPLDATELRLDSQQVGLRNDGAAAHAEFRHGPMTPVSGNASLDAVLHGTPPDRAFDDRQAFRDAVRRAQNRTGEWAKVDGPLVVRQVTWGEFDVTLVGA